MESIIKTHYNRCDVVPKRGRSQLNIVSTVGYLSPKEVLDRNTRGIYTPSIVRKPIEDMFSDVALPVADRTFPHKNITTYEDVNDNDKI